MFNLKLLIKEIRAQNKNKKILASMLLHIMRSLKDQNRDKKYYSANEDVNEFFIPDGNGGLKTATLEEAREFAETYQFKEKPSDYLDKKVIGFDPDLITPMKEERGKLREAIRRYADTEKERGNFEIEKTFREIDAAFELDNSPEIIKNKIDEVVSQFNEAKNNGTYKGSTRWQYKAKMKTMERYLEIETLLQPTGLKNIDNTVNRNAISGSEFLIKMPNNEDGLELSGDVLKQIMKDIQKDFYLNEYHFIGAALHKDEKHERKDKDDDFYTYGNHLHFQLEGMNRKTFQFDLPTFTFNRTLQLAEEMNIPFNPELKKFKKWSEFKNTNYEDRVLLMEFGELHQEILFDLANKSMAKVEPDKRIENENKLTQDQLKNLRFNKMELDVKERELKKQKIKEDVQKKKIYRTFQLYNAVKEQLNERQEELTDKEELIKSKDLKIEELNKRGKALVEKVKRTREEANKRIEDIEEKANKKVEEIKNEKKEEVKQIKEQHKKEIDKMEEEKKILETYIQTVEPKATKKLNQSFSIPAKERQEIKKFIATQSIIKNKKREEINKALTEYLSNPEIYKPKKVDNEDYNDDTILDTLKNAFKSPKRLETQEEINERINNHINNVIFKDFPLNDIKALQEENAIQKRQNKRLMEILKSKSKDIMTRETIETLQQRLENTVPVKQYNDLVNDFNTINEENTALKATNKTLKESNTELEEENNTLKGKITEYKAKLQKLGFYFIDQFKAKKDAFIMELFTWKAEQKNKEDKNIVVNCQNSFEQNTMEYKELEEIEDLSNTDNIDTDWGTNTLKKDKSRKYDI